MTKSYYHATPIENLDSIIMNGIHKSWDGVVYLTTEPTDAIKFLAIRGYKECLVCKVALNEELVEEQFDHNEKFFGCKAYGYSDDISPYDIEDYIKYIW